MKTVHTIADPYPEWRIFVSVNDTGPVLRIYLDDVTVIDIMAVRPINTLKHLAELFRNVESNLCP